MKAHSGWNGFRRNRALPLRVMRLGLVLIAATVSSAVHAQSPSEQMHLHLDPAATEIHYTLKATMHSVKGNFRLKSGEVTVDTKTGAVQGKIEVDLTSGTSGNDSRDDRMKREILETDKFPLATFEVEKSAGFNTAAASQTISVDGVFTLHGSPHPMTMQIMLARDAGSDHGVTATTSFKIPYIAWGIKDPSIPFVHVDKEVTVEITAKGTLQAQ